MSENLNYVSEFVVDKSNELLNYRDSLINKASGFGPPDLVVLYKSFHGSLTSSHAETHQYGHWVIGANNSSPEAVSKYFEKLLKEQPSSAWYSPGSFRILGGLYCSYDCFSGCDVRIDLNLRSDSYASPGVTAYAIDENGNRFPPTAELWKSLFVSAGLRCAAMPISYIPCLRTLNEHLIEKEKQFYNETADLIERGYAQLRGINEKKHGDIVLSTMYKYLSTYSRSEDIIKLFTPISNNSSIVATYLAESYSNTANPSQSSQSFKDAIAILLRAIRKDPFSIPLLRSLTKQLLNNKRSHIALPLAKTLVEQDPLSPESWIILAQVYFQLRKPSKVLIALNGLPINYHMKKETKDNNDDIIINLPSDVPAIRLTKPNKAKDYNSPHEWWFYDAERIHKEENPEDYIDSDDEDEAKLMTYIDKPKLKAADLDEMSLKAYKILSELEQALSWPKLVKVCRKIFYMDGSSNNKNSTNNKSLNNNNTLQSSSSRELNSELSQYEAEQRRVKEQEEQFRKKLQFDHNNNNEEKTLNTTPSLHDLAKMYRDKMNEDDGTGLGFAPAFMPVTQQHSLIQPDVSITLTMNENMNDYSPSSSPARSRTMSLADDNNNSGIDGTTSTSMGDLYQVIEQQEDVYKHIMATRETMDEQLAADYAAFNKRVVKLSRRPTKQQLKNNQQQPEHGKISNIKNISSLSLRSISSDSNNNIQEAEPVMDIPLMSARGSRVELEIPLPTNSGDNTPPDLSPNNTSLVKSPLLPPFSPTFPSALSRQRSSKSSSNNSNRRRSSKKKRSIPRRKCSVWLKKLLEFLYQDLAVLYSWHQDMDERKAKRKARAERRAKETKSPTSPKNKDKKKKLHHQIDIGSGDDSDSSSSSSSSSDSSSTSSDSSLADDKRSVAAWLAYASLANRLHRRSDAESAYREALKQDRLCLSAWHGLMELYSEAGFIRPALVAAGELCNIDAEEFPERDVAPKCVITGLCKLIRKHGLQAVFDDYVKLDDMDGCKNYIARFFEYVRKHKVDGWQR